MRKTFTRLLFPVCAAALCPSVHAAVSLPWTETFDSNDAMDQFTVLDSNGDSNEWEWNRNYSCAWVSYNSDIAMDDWLVTPAFNLEAGGVYKFRLDARNNFGVEKFEVFAGREAAAEAMTIPVIGLTSVTKSSFTSFSGEFTVPESGCYYIGIHGCSAPDQMYLYVDNLQLTHGVSAHSPAAVGDLKVTPDASGASSVTVSCVLPLKTESGDALASIDRLEVICDNDVVHEATALVPGDTFGFVHENATNGRHTYTVVAYCGSARGREASAEVFVGPNIPGHVRNPKVGEFTPGKVTLRWDAPDKDVDGNPINPALVTYKVVRFEIMDNSLFTEEDIPGAESLTATEYVHTAIGEGEGQIYTAYGVYAMTSAGKSKRVDTPLFPVGDSYETPYMESFAEGVSMTLFRSETIKNERTVPVWDAFSDMESDLKAWDKDGGYLAMTGESEDDCARFYSGKIALSGLETPALSFYVYNLHNGVNAPDKNTLEVYVSDGTRFLLCKEFAMTDLPRHGWNRVVVPLDDYAGKTIQFAFQGTIKNYMTIPVDGITVNSLAACDLAVLETAVPEGVTAGRAFGLTVAVENRGMSAASGYTVELYRDGTLLQTAKGPSVEPSAVAEVAFTDIVSVLNPADVSYHAVVRADGDADSSNDVGETVKVTVTAPLHPVPVSLSGENSGSTVRLSWNAPDFSSAVPEAVTDDFESYDSYAVTGVGDWIFTDADGKQVGKLDLVIPGITYAGSVQSFWVMDANTEGANSLYAARSGSKYLAQIFNNDNSQCDDWAISPELFGGSQTISFYARSYSSFSSFAERFEVLYSTGSTAPADFTLLATVDAVPNAWTRYEYTLPEGASRFAVRCTSTGCYMLFIDDVTFIPASGSSALELAGYNVYRNGELLNDAPVSDSHYEDAAPDGTHSYVVTALYDKGESLPSDEFVTTVSGIEDVASDGAATVDVTGGNGEIIITGVHGLLPVEICRTDGVAVTKLNAETPQKVSVTPGVYIVKADTRVFKVSVR